MYPHEPRALLVQPNSMDHLLTLNSYEEFDVMIQQYVPLGTAVEPQWVEEWENPDDEMLLGPDEPMGDVGGDQEMAEGNGDEDDEMLL